VTQQASSTTTLLQPYVTNLLDPSVNRHAMVAGIIGDHPSLYAKSPSIWNAAFADLSIEATYLSFDVSSAQLPGLVNALRECRAYVGGNVTVPHKLAVMDLLDQLDPLAAQIGAVNTIRRTQDGRLVGYNTDASGTVKSLTMPSPWQTEPFMEALPGKSLLLIGAGGAGRAAAFALARELGSDGRIYIANRSLARGSQLADQVKAVYGNAQAVEENVPREVLAEIDLVINSSTKGQAGLRHLDDGMVTCLEPYSALSPAAPAVLAEAQYPNHTSLYDAWYRASAPDIKSNLAASDESMLQVRSQTRFFDMVYAPLETPMLLQARLKGHATINGKGMNIMQAVDAFASIVLEDYFKNEGWNEQQSFEVVQKSMASAW